MGNKKVPDRNMPTTSTNSGQKNAPIGAVVQSAAHADQSTSKSEMPNTGAAKKMRISCLLLRTLLRASGDVKTLKTCAHQRCS